MSEEGQVIACRDLRTWHHQMSEGPESNKLIVVGFTASCCESCKFMAPVLDELAKKFTNDIFLMVDVDELKPVVVDCGVDSTPTFIFMKDGRIVDKFVGAANKDELQKLTETHATVVVAVA
ncbi:hypothetical protein Tsubulata_003908 [Turnera subulata]|uniref:Thioredoxin domain-containing protein n=1 Tax=Turnera subulata TaxID=218843 RepID=A0A9Q0GIE3_9ROSI|nr:hypothetical protein Tsubulata_003908 [Turnera subulata]